jgi:hypothetical protein
MPAINTLLAWLLHALVAVLIFFVVQWLLPLLLGLVGLSLPDNILILIALVLALGYFVGGVSGRLRLSRNPPA